MEVKASNTMISVTIEISPDELAKLDYELNRVYEIATKNSSGEQFEKIWELKDKLNIAVKG